MLCPKFKEQCGGDCAWMVKSRRKVDGVMVEEKCCVVVALSRELAELNRRAETDRVPRSSKP